MGPTGRLVTIRRSGLDGAHFPLSLSTCLFGRGIECDIRIQLPVVSKQHCKIEVRDQKAVLFNFSAANPTQVNGSAVDGPVQLKHGDVITVIDRSFRYENDSHPDGSKSIEFPGQRCEQKSPRRVSRSSFSSNPEGKVPDRSAARSQVTEEGGSGGPPERREHVGAARTPSRGSGGPATKGTADAGSSEPPGDHHGNAAGPLAGGFGARSRVTAASWNGGQDPEKDGENESPFRKLYESMKEEFDVKPEKEAVPQNRRKSGSRGQGASEPESATQPRVSPKARRRSGRSSQAEAKRAGEGLAQTPEATPSPSMPPTETPKAKIPAPCSQQNSSQKRRSGELSVTRGGGPVSVQPREDLGADRAASAPRRLSARQQTPTNGTSAGDLGNPAEKVSSRKRRRSLSPMAGVLSTGTDFPKQALPSLLPVPTEQKVPGGALDTPRQQGATAPGSPGLSAVDVSNIGDALSKTEGKPLKRRRVSFGGHLRPELFDENLPPNTPLKRGETPRKRRSLVAHTPPVLKKIIKEQPSEKGEPSEIHSEVAPQNSPTNTSPLINDARRRSPKPPASSGSKSPHHTDAPKRGGRRSSSGPARRASVDRSQRGILQTIHSRRRSGASEANLMVSRSWADVVKLSAKQTQTKVMRHGPPRPGPPRPPSRRQRRVNTPKKPLASVRNEFSTGHAASPCTIVIGRAHIEKVSAPARPYRMLNNFVINKKIDFNEDLSGLTEMFKTPAKEKPQTMSLGPTTFSNSEDSLGKKFQVLNSEDKPLLCTPEKFGEKDPNAPEELWDKQSSSPAFTQQYVTVNGNMKTPQSETELPKAASSINKFRRSVELRNIQVTSAECGKDDKEVDTVQNVLGRCLRKSSVQTQLPEGEMKERERSFGTCNKDNEPRENSEKPITGRRSRRSSELKCTPRAGLVLIQTLQETESKEDLEGSHTFLQNSSRAEEPVGTETKTLLMHCKSPAPVSTPTKVNTRIKTPSQRANVEDLSDLRKPTRTPGDIADTQKEPAGGAKSMKEFKEAPDQKLDSSENVTGSRRRSRTPRRKAQPIEDLMGFRELFQTPSHIVETVTHDKTPGTSPQPEPGSTPTSTKRRFRSPVGKVDVEEEFSALRKPTPRPGETTHSCRAPINDDKDIKAVKETPKQKLDSAGNINGSRRSRTPIGKVQPIEDLVGFRELFQTPDHTMESLAENKTSKTPSRSPKPEPLSTKRCFRTPVGKVDMEDESAEFFKQTPEQKLGSAKYATGSRRRSRTPRRKVQPIEDLAGFKELFQTPNHILGTVTDDKITKTLCKSPKSAPVSTPTSSKRHSRTPLRKVDVQEALSALRKPTPRPGETTHAHREPEGDDKGITAFKETPQQKPDSAENVTGSRRRSRTPRRKVQPIEDLAGFKELFQTPIHIAETVTDDKTKTPCNSPQPEPVSTPTNMTRRLRTPVGKMDVEEELSALRKPTPGETTHSHREPEGDDKGITAFKETPEQKLDSAKYVTGSGRRSRTPRRKVQPMEDLVGFKELFQTPDHILETVTDDKITKTSFKSPKSEPVSTPTSSKRCFRTPLGKVDMQEALSALRKPTPRPGETTHLHRAPECDDKSTELLMETPKQELDSVEKVTRSRRRSKTPKRKVQPMEDLVGFKELFQTPNHIIETVTDDKIIKTSCKSPKSELISTPTSTKRRSRTPLGKVDLQEALSALRKPTPRPGESTHSHREPEGDDKGITAFKETPQQKPDSAENVTGSRRRSRTPRRKAQPIEDLAGFKELFQTPDHTVEPMTDDKTKTLCNSPQPEPVSTPTSMTRRLRTPLGKMDVEEELSALRKPTPGETTHSHREPEGDDKDITAFKEAPEQKPDSAENIIGSRRRSRTPKRKVQPIEDLVGFKELFQTPDHIMESSADDKTTKIPCKSQNPEPVIMLPGRNRCVKAPQGKVVVDDELPALRRPTRTLGKTTRSHRAPEAADEETKVLGEIPEEKSDPAENVTGSKRRLRTHKEKAQPMEDLAGLKDEPETLVQTTEVPSKAPQVEAVLPARRKRPVRAPPRKADMEEELSAPRKSARTSARTTRSHRAPEAAAEDTKLLEEIPEEKSDPTENVTGGKRRPRARKEKAQPLEDLAGLKEPLHSSCHTEEPETLVQTTEVPSEAPQPAAVLPARRTRQVRAPPRKADEEEKLSAPKKPTRTSARATRSHRAPEAADEDIKLLKEIPEEKLDPAENAAGNKRRPRARKEKAQPPEDMAGLKDEPETAVQTTEVPSESPQSEAVLPARRQRPLRAPPRKADVEEEPSAPRTSGKTTRPRRGPADVTVFEESPRQGPGPAADTAGGKRQLRSRKGRAQPPEGPARRQPLPQSPVQDEEPDVGTENKPAKPRRVLWAPDVKPVEGQAGRGDPGTPPGGVSVPLAPKRKPGDGSPTRTRGLRTSARAQDPAEEKPAPKRQRTAPQERREPPEPLGAKRRRGAVADSTEDVPGEDLGTKTRGRRAPVTSSPGKGVSLRSRLPAKTSSAEHTPGVPGTAGAGKTKRSGRKPAPASAEAKSHSPEDGAGSSAPGDAVRERRACPRPGRRGRAPEPSAAGEKAPGETPEETEGARPAGLTQRRARKVTVPPAGDTAESQPRPRATRSAKRPAGEARQEDNDTAVKKIRTRSRRGREDV